MNLALGRDFWLYRLGQVISRLGDSCTGIAVAWWVLGKTGSAMAMSKVLVPSAVLALVLNPLFGPLGDRFARKRLIILADLWRLLVILVFLLSVHLDYFDLHFMSLLYALYAVGSSLFSAGAGAIVPQLVPRELIPAAERQSQGIDAFSGIAGGVFGGLMVALLGIKGAVSLDALSFGVSVLATCLIRANTKPQRAAATSHPFRSWMDDFRAGIRVMFRLKVFLWVCAVAMVLNLSLAPLGVLLPVMAREVRGFPAWFLGGMESSLGVGAILGTLTLGFMRKRLRADVFFVLSLVLMGASICFVPVFPGVVLPLVLLASLGLANSWAGVVIGTQFILTVPDHFRARIGSIMGFLSGGMNPLGLALGGWLLTAFGFGKSAFLMGGVMVLLSPLMLAIPLLKEFLGASPEEAATFFDRHYSAEGKGPFER